MENETKFAIRSRYDRINKKKVSHEFAVKGLNFMGTKEHYGHEYNVKTGKIDATDGSTVLTNVSYKLEF